MSKRAWLTPDDAPASLDCWRVFIPSGEAYRAAFRGAMILLSQDWNWEEHGAQSPETVADLWVNANAETFRMVKCMPVGAVIYGGWSSAPDGFLDCDGSSYNTADYPELFAAIGYVWGGVGSNFNVPDLRDRVAVGVSPTIPLGTTGGAKTHTLLASEIPSHNHSIPGTLTTLNEIPVGTTPVLTPNVVSSVTGNTGGGGAHNNMQPYAGLRAVIAYR